MEITIYSEALCRMSTVLVVLVIYYETSHNSECYHGSLQVDLNNVIYSKVTYLSNFLGQDNVTRRSLKEIC